MACSVSAHAQSVEADKRAAASVVRALHDALKLGDTAAVANLLARDAVVLESGHKESREEYLAHHLAADIAFMQSVKERVLDSRVEVDGNTAWSTTTSRLEGTHRGRPVKQSGSELIVLTRKGASWQIRAIHWSSHQIK